MKVTTLLTVTMTTIIFSGYAQALNVPDPSLDLNSCRALAETEAANDRCDALDYCNKNQSADRTQRRECYFQAEANYGAAAAMEARGSYPAAGAPYPAAGATVPPPAATSRVSTEVADSDYERQTDSNKGWKNANQGD